MSEGGDAEGKGARLPFSAALRWMWTVGELVLPGLSNVGATGADGAMSRL